jgi:hypothetical protein
MGTIMLYYYYPEKLVRATPWVHQLAEVLVACEQFEAYSNRQRGGDYYARRRETLVEAFNYLEKLRLEGMVSQEVIDALRLLAAEGTFDVIMAEARGTAFSKQEKRYLRQMARGATCR